MDSKKPIKLNDAVIQKQGYDTASGVTKLTCTSSFDQITAECIGVKDALFDDGGVRRNGVSEWHIKKEFLGCTATFTPYQANIWNSPPMVVKAPMVEFDKVLTQDADGRLKMSLKLYVEGFPGQGMGNFITAVGKNTCSLLLERPQTLGEKKEAEIQAANLKLFTPEKPPKEKDDSGDGKSTKEKDTGKDVGPTLASAREMGSSTRRGRKKGQ